MRRVALFGFGSTVGALIDLCAGVLLLALGLPGWLVLALTMCVSASVVYAIHQKITFADLANELNAGRLSQFLLATAGIYVIRVSVFTLLGHVGVPETLAFLAAIVSSFLVNFTISRFLIFAIGRR